MFITKKRHEAVIKLLREQVETHVMLGRGREKNIQRLIMERDTARAEAEANKADAEAVVEQGKDEGATYVLSSLASALHVEDWSIQNGSEEWEGDVWATMFRILVDAGVVEEDHHQVATHGKIAGLERAVASLTPDALKYRERCRRDREHAASKRKRQAA